MPLTGPEIHHDGQIIAMVVAEIYEIARDASHRIGVRYASRTPAATMDSPGVEITHPDALDEKELKAGDFAAAFAAAPVKVEGVYRTPAQHQNAIELYSTTAFWDRGELTIHEPTQSVVELAHGTAMMTGVDPTKVHVVNPYIGGAFGGKGFMTQRTALIAGAVRALGRPVRNVVTRDQGFTLATCRAETKHHVRLAADHKGRLLAYGHEAWELQSRRDDYPLAGFGVTTAMYGAPAILTRASMVKADRQSSGFMRGKPLTFAFGAEFVEVRVHRLTREIRVPRMTGAFAAGRIGNPRTARSQYMGGMIWGMASALLEATEIDEKRGRYVNDSLGEYLMAVNADVPRVDVIMVPEEDGEVNPLGVKGIGELGIVGTAAVVANAVHHATGKRIRDLPIVMDKLST